MSSREQFEAWWEINYHNGNPPRFGWSAYREDGGYKIDDDESELDAMWNAWQAATSAMEAKCAALAAEREIVNADNAYLRDQIMCWARECDRITYTHTNKVTDSHQSEAEQDLANTYPASSAYLAEVRAQGVEMFANWSDKHIENDDEYEDVLTELSRAARGFANQLRQEAQ